MPTLVRTDLAAQRLHRILLFVTGSIEPPLDRRELPVCELAGEEQGPLGSGNNTDSNEAMQMG